MSIENRVRKVVTEDDHKAFMLLFDEDPGDWREEPEQYDEILSKFRKTFDDCVRMVESNIGTPSYIEREYSKRSPDWAPMGLYADWMIKGTDSIICIFMGGDGNPEDPLTLIAGRTRSEARFSPDDPWDWQWID